jgi:hypothetical protein
MFLPRFLLTQTIFELAGQILEDLWPIDTHIHATSVHNHLFRVANEPRTNLVIIRFSLSTGAIIQPIKKQGDSLDIEIKRFIGKCQHYVGDYLLNKWQLPTIHTVNFKHYLDADQRGDERELINLLRLGQCIRALLLEKPDFEMDEVLVVTEQLAVSTASVTKVVDI